jgi:hypothetical protein
LSTELINDVATVESGRRCYQVLIVSTQHPWIEPERVGVRNPWMSVAVDTGDCSGMRDDRSGDKITKTGYSFYIPKLGIES